MRSYFEETILDAVRSEFDWDEVFNRTDIFDEISKDYDPDNIFTKSQLETWAECNGYVKE